MGEDGVRRIGHAPWTVVDADGEPSTWEIEHANAEMAWERARVWKPGDPCFTCGSTDTVLVCDGVLQVGAHCNGCGADDWSDE